MGAHQCLDPMSGSTLLETVYPKNVHSLNSIEMKVTPPCTSHKKLEVYLYGQVLHGVANLSGIPDNGGVRVHMAHVFS